MEAISIQEHSHGVHNSLHSSQFLIESSPSEFQDGINRQQTGKCGHFSIRGYVSETRKKDWRNNWPFFLPEETSKLELCKNILPPLLAIDSRWWRCSNCTRINNSETEVVHVGCMGETSMPYDYLSKETSLLPYSNDHSAQSISECVKVSAEHNSSGVDVCPNISTQNKKMEEAGLHLSGREASNGAIETCVTSPDYQIQEEVLDEISNEIVHEVTEAEVCKKGVSKETSEGAISLDLNKPAWDSSSDEIESGVSPVELELEASKVWCRPITHESNDVGFLNLNEEIVVASCKDSYQCHEDSRKSSKMDIPSSMNNGMPELAQKDKLYGKPHEIGSGIKQISSPLACLNPVNVDTSREPNQDKVDCWPVENAVENESPCGTSSGSLKRKRKQKMRLLTDILKTKDLAASEENHVASAKVKNRKHMRETGVENAEHFQTVRTRLQPWNVNNHGGNEETQITGTLASNDEPEPTAKNTSVRKKNKAASYIDDQSLILQGQVIYVEPKTSNGIAETEHLTNARDQKKSMERKQQKRTQETEDIHPRQRNDISKSGTALYSQEHVSIPRNDDQDWRNTRTQGEAAVDDIPMDIVELLAKNQFERRLHKFQEGIGNRSSKSGSDVMYANRDDPLCNNVRSSDRTVVFSSHRKFNEDINRDIHQMENSTTSKGFSPWVQTQGKGYGLQNSILNSGGGSNGGPINCMQFLEDCRKNQMASQYINGQVYHDGRMVAVGGTHYDTNKKRSTDLRIRDHSAVGYVKANLVPPQGGNRISALKTNSEIFPNLNYPSLRKENRCQKVVNPMDLSQNESISASDLLRLMQQGASSSALPIDGRERICEQPFFSNGRSHKFFELEAGASNCIGFPVRSQSFQRITQNQQMRNTFELFPPLGRSGTYGSALLGEEGSSSNLGQPFELRSGFESDMQNFTSKTRKLDKMKQSLSATKVVSPRPNKAGLTSDLLEHLSLSRTKASLPANKAESHNKIETDLPMRKRSVHEICTLNKNPAEFSLPEDGNIYMIKGECLKPLKASSSEDNTDGRKRQRKAKLTSMREH